MSNLNSYYIKSYLAKIEAGIILFIILTKKHVSYRLFCEEFYINITLIRHICNMFMLKKVNRSDLGPIDHSFDIYGPDVRLTNTDKHT